MAGGQAEPLGQTAALRECGSEDVWEVWRVANQ